LPEDEVCIGNVLADAGYRTGYVGKWHLDGVPRDRFTPPGPRRQGFEFWAVWNCSHDYFHGRVFRDTDEAIELGGYEPVGQTDLALEFLDTLDDRPFCLFLSWGTPHAPYGHVPDEYKALYDPETIELRPNVREGAPPGYAEARQPLDREAIAGYTAHITALDEQMGRLLDDLDARGLAENTLVVFTSDHGDMLWSQGAVKKEQPWEESVQIPFLLRWPGRVPAGRTCDALISTVDFMPTLLGMMDCPVPEGNQGVDLSAIALGGDGPGQESVFLTEPVIVDQGAAQGVREWRGVRTKQHTYARWFDGVPWVLYDNDADLYQLTNLVDSPEHAMLREYLDGMTDDWLERTGDACTTWQETIRSLGLADAWRERESYMHPNDPRELT
ncbi:sulfatase, partial [bacterium]|nr:sulfatase [bacterium]